MKRLAVLVLSLGALVGATSAYAQSGGDARGNDFLGADWGRQQNEARQGVRQGHFVPLSRVIAEINGRTPGYQLDAGIEDEGGRQVYRVRWAASNGRRIDYIVDAASGAILSAR